MQAFIQRNRIVLMHLSFWCLYFSFFFYQITFSRRGEEPDYTRAFLDATTQVFFMAVISYLNYFYHLPKFLKDRNFGKYILGLLISFALVITLHIYVKRIIYEGYMPRAGFLYSSKFIVQHVFTAFFNVIFVGMLKFAEDWFEFEAKKKEVENEKLTAELRFLKAQINPHFLFNTLNNLYYLAFINSPNTTVVIEKLSQMMRYMIYDSNHAKVPLSKEIEYMKNYISLENLRLNDEIPIQFEIKGNTDRLMIVPLIFITFLENAFKHGVSNNDPNAWVHLSIEIEGNSCIYSVENSKRSTSEKSAEESPGIGLQNLKRRLELSYHGQYHLEVQDQADTYAVQLRLTLNQD